MYNSESFLSRTLDSVLRQTLTDFEVVISDNASTDGTADLCRSYAARDGRIRYHRNHRNIGMARNFDRLVELSNGEYFKWVASDDVLAPDYLRRCVDFLERDNSLVLVTTGLVPVEASGKPVPFDAARNTHVTSYGERFPPLSRPKAVASPRASSRFRSVLLDLKGHVATVYVYGLFRAAAMKQTSLLQPFLGSEKVFLAELSLRGRFYQLPEDLLLYTLRSDRVGRYSAKQAAKLMNPERSRFMLPEAERVPGYLRAVNAADLGPPDRARCVLGIFEYVVRGALEWIVQSVKTRRGARSEQRGPGPA